MLYLTCTIISSVDLACYRVSRAKDWVSVDCGTRRFIIFKSKGYISIDMCSLYLHEKPHHIKIMQNSETCRFLFILFYFFTLTRDRMGNSRLVKDK